VGLSAPSLPAHLGGFGSPGTGTADSPQKHGRSQELPASRTLLVRTQDGPWTCLVSLGHWSSQHRVGGGQLPPQKAPKIQQPLCPPRPTWRWDRAALGTRDCSEFWVALISPLIPGYGELNPPGRARAGPHPAPTEPPRPGRWGKTTKEQE